MDSPSSEPADGCGRLSLSLVSYGTDDEDVDLSTAEQNSSDTLMPDIVTDVTQRADKVAGTDLTNEEDLITSIANQLGVSNEKLEKVSVALEKMEISQQKYLKSKFIMNSVASIASDPRKLPEQTACRVNQIINHISLMDYVMPADIDSTDGVFGLSQNYLLEHFPKELTAVDFKSIREAVAEDIASKHKKLLEMDTRYSEKLSRLSGSPALSSNTCIELNSTHELLSLHQDLDREISIYESYLLESDKILTSLAKLKVDSFDSLNSNRVKHLKDRSGALKSEIQSLNNQIINGLYHEDQHLITAHANLKRNLDLALNEARSQLLDLQKKGSEYEKLRGTHFDRLVKEYKDLKSQIAQKEYALSTLSK